MTDLSTIQTAGAMYTPSVPPMYAEHVVKDPSSVRDGNLPSGVTLDDLNFPKQKSRIDSLRNFGIADEETVIGPGINGKLNELQASMGLLKLETIDAEIEQLGRLAATYRQGLEGIEGLSFPEPAPSVDHNCGYFPILVDPSRYGMSRDELYTALKQFNVHPRKYFHPLCSTFSCYASLPSARPDNLPVATQVACRVLCLPIYPTLDEIDVGSLCALLRELPGVRRREDERIGTQGGSRWRS